MDKYNGQMEFKSFFEVNKKGLIHFKLKIIKSYEKIQNEIFSFEKKYLSLFMTVTINHNLESIKKHFKIKSMNLNF
jgi:hypothetical protein